jgi:Fe-S-cluster containining protein
MPLLTTDNYSLDTCNNCTVYKTRPAACQGYNCAWVLGAGEEEDRPDKSGIMFDNIAPSKLIEGGLLAKPLWLHAEREEAGSNAIENVSRSTNAPVLVLEFTEKRLLKIVGRGVE